MSGGCKRPPPTSVGTSLHRWIDWRKTHRFPKSDCEVHHRAVGHWHSERHTSQLPEEQQNHNQPLDHSLIIHEAEALILSPTLGTQNN